MAMQTLKFTKMHGLGNDFVILDFRKEPFFLMPDQVRFISDRKIGVGCDQLIVLRLSASADCLMEIYNADGTKAGACGNATRCVAMLLGSEKSVIQVGDRIITCQKDGENITANMGSYSIKRMDLAGHSGYFVDVGNPHFVAFSNADAESAAADIVPHFEGGINVSIAKINENQIELSTCERGVGLTLACGSAACAAAVAGHIYEHMPALIEVKMQLGSLEVQVANGSVTMKGGATLSFKGEINLESTL